jgi:hypothetical protein
MTAKAIQAFEETPQLLRYPRPTVRLPVGQTRDTLFTNASFPSGWARIAAEDRFVLSQRRDVNLIRVPQGLYSTDHRKKFPFHEIKSKMAVKMTYNLLNAATFAIIWIYALQH